MASVLRALALITGLVTIALAGDGAERGSANYSSCQRKTDDPLHGCPDGTLYVSRTDHRANYLSIQSAIAALSNDTSPRFILIGSGVYTEQLNVTRSGPLTLLGQSDNPSKGLSYSDVAYNTTTANDVQVYHNAANSNSRYPDNVHTGVITIGPTLNATQTGAGPTGWGVPPNTPFGCSDFRVYNIDFRNELFPHSAGPAHAVGVGYSNAGFYSCGFYSYQDTVFVGKLANVVMYDCIVAGQTDFLYGFGTLFVRQSTLLLRSCGGGITAWKGTNTTFTNKYGVYITDSKVLATNTTVLRERKGKCSLGRPWNALHRSVFMNTYLDASILPAGYTEWGGQPGGNLGVNTTLAVYETYGPGNDQKAQKVGKITAILDAAAVQPYLRPVDVFMTPEGGQPNVQWIEPVALGA